MVAGCTMNNYDRKPVSRVLFTKHSMEGGVPGKQCKDLCRWLLAYQSLSSSRDGPPGLDEVNVYCSPGPAVSILGKPELASPSLPLPPPTVCGGGRMGAGECELDPKLISQAASLLCSLDTKHSCSLEGINPATPHSTTSVPQQSDTRKKLHPLEPQCKSPLDNSRSYWVPQTGSKPTVS